MEVLKFGGASVKDAGSVRNVCAILKNYNDAVVVISAMGKTTNNLECVVKAYLSKDSLDESIQKVKRFHESILSELFPEKTAEIWKTFETIFNYLNLYLQNAPGTDSDEVYDQIVPIGELLSSKILSAFLISEGIDNQWLDARKLLRTDGYFRKANVSWEESENNFKEAIGDGIYVTQGFIGGTDNNLMTTLGREGSDYSAALICNMIDGEKLTVWKDVPGIMNADPRYFNHPKKLDHISYREAIELSFYGATVIHPKTIKPLQNKNISLYVRSFVEPDGAGTLIDQETQDDENLPIYIYKPKQLLLSLSRKDFGFLEEEHLSQVFQLLHEHKLGVNIMQNSAINFSLCMDYESERIEPIIPILQEQYRVLYNTDLDLLTIRHHKDATIDSLTGGHDVILEQKTRSTLKLLMRNLSE